MSATVTWSGLNELRRALNALPQDLAQEAHAIVHAHAVSAERDIEQGYPEGPTGNLKGGVTLSIEGARAGVTAIVRSRAPHASIFERGTRRRMTRKGANRGTMPQPPFSQRMIPKAIAWRERMYRALIAMCERHGLLVTKS